MQRSAVRLLLVLPLSAVGLLSVAVIGHGTVSAASVRNLGFASAPVSGEASSTADLGPIVVQLQNAGAPVDAPEGGVLVSLDPAPSGGTFALTQNGRAGHLRHRAGGPIVDQFLFR